MSLRLDIQESVVRLIMLFSVKVCLLCAEDIDCSGRPGPELQVQRRLNYPMRMLNPNSSVNPSNNGVVPAATAAGLSIAFPSIMPSLLWMVIWLLLPPRVLSPLIWVHETLLAPPNLSVCLCQI